MIFLFSSFFYIKKQSAVYFIVRTAQLLFLFFLTVCGSWAFFQSFGTRQNAACSENYYTCLLKEWLLLPNNQTTFLCNYCVAQGKNICQMLTISKKRKKKLLSISVVLKLHNLFQISKVLELEDPFFKITGWVSEVLKEFITLAILSFVWHQQRLPLQFSFLCAYILSFHLKLV